MPDSITRKEFLASAVLATAALVPARGRALLRQKRPPNVIIITGDEWRAQAFGYAGDPNAQTAAIDAFARESVSFRQAISGTPVCSPARASIQTGQYPLTHKLYVNDVPLKPTSRTLAQAFAGAGYYTAYIGKWHLYGSPDGHYGRRLQPVPRNERFGYEYWKASECTHDYNHSLYYEGDDPTPKYWPGYDAVAQTDDAIGLLERRAHSGQPLMMMLSWGPPHFPYSAPEEYAARYRDRDIVLRPNVPTSAHAEAVAELRGYYAAAAVLDDCFAKLMAAIDRLRIRDDTIVLFTSDHGEMAFSQNLEYKLVPWDESVRVPFLLRYPGLLGRTGRVIDLPINAPDVMPTLLGLAGIPLPGGVEGTDFSPALLGKTEHPVPNSAYMSLPATYNDSLVEGIAEYRGVRTARYTYARTITKPWLLYDNVNDPFQKRNLVDDPTMVPVVHELDAELNQWRIRLKDDFLPTRDYLKRDGLEHYLEVNFPVNIRISPWNDWTSTMAVPALQHRSVDASVTALAEDPVSAPIVAKLLGALRLKKLDKGRYLSFSPRVINAYNPGVLSTPDFLTLEAALKRLPRLDN